MNYLFFDTECANCFDGDGKICEFGYALTDENYTVIEKDNIIINPECEFDKKGLAMSKIKLALPYSGYLKYGNFTAAYEKIRSLFARADIAVGHNTQADAQYLLYACHRYSLESFDYKFIDTQKEVRELYDRQKSLRLIDIHNDFCGVEEKQSHIGLDDAMRTMDLARFVQEEKGVSPKELLSLNPKCCGEVFMDRVVEYEFNLLPYSTSPKMSNKKNRRIFDAFVSEMPPSSTAYSFPSEYERDSFPQMMVILNRLKEKGFSYSDQVKGTTYVSLSKDEYKLRFTKRCRVIPFDEFLAEIDLSKDELLSPDILPIVASMSEHKPWYEAYLRAHEKK